MNADSKSKIPEKFYKEGNHPVAETVGELKSILAELPDDLPFETNWGNAAQVVVYNYKYADCHCRIEEVEETDDED